MDKYTYEEVAAASSEYFGGEDFAAGVIVNKYLLRDDEGNYLEKTPDDMHDRIAAEFARIEAKHPNSIPYKDIREALDRFKLVIPQGSPMFGIGNNIQTVSIANCYVVGSPADSYGGIMERDEQLAQIMKRRGGVGLDISTLRPTGAIVKNSARTADGIGCFMERFSNTTKEVAQNGRRGALMITIDCRHPDLEKFINIKRDKTKVTGANISVRWNDEFLRAVEANEKYTLRFPVEASIEDAACTKEVDAKAVWQNFIQANWEAAEPGCLFWDTITGQSISDCYADVGFKTISTNPCGEITLSEHGACILQVLNLFGFVTDAFTPSAKFNWKKFKKYVRLTARLMDDMIDLELEKCDDVINKVSADPEQTGVRARELKLWKSIRKTYIDGRRVGMGITALADMLAAVGIRYGSEEALEMIDKVFSTMHTTAYEENAILAKERGPFPVWDWEKEKDSHYIKILPKKIRDLIQKNGRRNIALLTCAPTGSVSIAAQSSSGIEPIFKRDYSRFRKLTQEELDRGVKPDRVDSDGISWISFEVYHQALATWREVNPDADMSANPFIGAQADELDWMSRVRTQATIQRYIDHSISSTCNLPTDVPVEEVEKLYLEAWKQKCKGITIYREGSRIGVLTDSTPKKPKALTKIIENHAPKRPDTLECDIIYSNVEKTPWIFFVGKLGDKPYDIFGGCRNKIDLPRKYSSGWIKKNGRRDGRRIYDLYLGSLDDENEMMVIKDVASEFSPDSGSYTRIISALLRHGVPTKYIVEQLRKDSVEASMHTFEKVIARILKKYITDGEKSCEKCDNCGDTFVYQDGCIICKSCGNGKCG